MAGHEFAQARRRCRLRVCMGTYTEASDPYCQRHNVLLGVHRASSVFYGSSRVSLEERTDSFPSPR